MNKVKVFKLDKKATVPTRNKVTDAGLDIFANETIHIPKGSTKLIKTGIAIEVVPGYVGKIEDRSGMALKGLRTGGGIIDSGFSGELSIVLHNLTADKDTDHILHKKGYFVKKGDRIAQILFYEISYPQVEIVDNLWTSERGSNGFSSSGR